MRERLQSKPSAEVQENLFAPGLKGDLEHYFDAMNLINGAHLLMLMKQGIIDCGAAKALAQGIRSMLRLPSGELSLLAEREDLYFNIEAHLISGLGAEVAGRLHTGRSRNDLYATATRIKVREIYFELCRTFTELMRQVMTLARAELDTVMPGYTHMQPAEPITLGYYFAGVAEALERDYTRLEQVYPRLNLSPLGACALAGTSFDIDRRAVAEYLGFDGLVENGLDAVASRDYVAELLAALAVAMTTVGRLAQDLYIWATDEFRAIEVSDSVAASSSIMPQKKNPVTLEHVKAKAAHINGALMSVLGVLKATPFTHSRDVSGESLGLFWPAVTELLRAIRLLTATITGMKVNRELLLARARRDFVTVTELANNLVRRLGLSFRQAHGIVGGMVAELVSQGKDAEAIDETILARALERSGISFDPGVLGEILDTSMDPVKNVVSKRMAGPAPQAVSATIDMLDKALVEHERLLSSRQEAVARSLKKLLHDLELAAGNQ